MTYYKMESSKRNVLEANSTLYVRIDFARYEGMMVFKNDVTGEIEIACGNYSGTEDDMYIGGYFIHRELLENSNEPEFLLALDVL